MYFSKIVKKCNTGSTVYNSIDYFPNGVRSFFSPLCFYPPSPKKLVPCFVTIYSYIDIHDDAHLWETWYSQNLRKITKIASDKFFGQEGYEKLGS